jgi:hypothetical protein
MVSTALPNIYNHTTAARFDMKSIYWSSKKRKSTKTQTVDKPDNIEHVKKEAAEFTPERKAVLIDKLSELYESLDRGLKEHKMLIDSHIETTTQQQEG